jgi:hypothetical protein
MCPYPKPAFWLCGVATRLSIAEARATPQGWKVPNPYIRVVPLPN